MGILDRRTAKRLEHDRAEQEKDHADAVAQWQAEDAQLRELLLEAQNPAWAERVSLILKKDERAFQVLEGAALIEPRRLSGHWEGRSQGVSLRVAKGVHYRVGKSTGHYVQGAEVPTPIDTGTLTITNRRVVFQGPKATREWAFSKLIGFQHVDLARAPWTAIQVSNRRRRVASSTRRPSRLAFASGSTWPSPITTVRSTSWSGLCKNSSSVIPRSARADLRTPFPPSAPILPPRSRPLLDGIVTQRGDMSCATGTAGTGPSTFPTKGLSVTATHLCPPAGGRSGRRGVTAGVTAVSAPLRNQLPSELTGPSQMIDLGHGKQARASRPSRASSQPTAQDSSRPRPGKAGARARDDNAIDAPADLLAGSRARQ